MKKTLKYVFYATIFSIIIYKSTGTDWSNIRYWIAGIGAVGMFMTGYYYALEVREEFEEDVEKDEDKDFHPYIEEDTMCDKCWMLHKCCIEEGIVVESTTNYDMRRHYVPIPGGHCPGFVRKGE